MLMRVLNLDDHPEVLIVADSDEELAKVRSTKLGNARFLLIGQLDSHTLQHELGDIARCTDGDFVDSGSGAPSIPGYEIRAPIASTYSATVYRAFSEEMRCEVALKICENKSGNNALIHQLRLREEFDILRKLGGRYIAKAYDYGEAGNACYAAIEYFPDGSIDKVLAERAGTVNRVEFMLGVAKGLSAIHEAGFLHLDLKPSNIMYRTDGSAAIIDFGISRRTLRAMYLGTPNFSVGSPYFMSPEQMRGERLDIRSDIYSYGALWYRVFTGYPPFRGRALESILAAHDLGEIPSMGSALKHYQPIVDRTLVQRREARFQTAEELVLAIENYAQSAIGVRKMGIDLSALKENYFANGGLPQVQALGT